jgi:hypothetical protein
LKAAFERAYIIARAPFDRLRVTNDDELGVKDDDDDVGAVGAR